MFLVISARGRGGRSALDIIGTGMLVGKIKIKPQKEITLKVLFLQKDVVLKKGQNNKNLYSSPQLVFNPSLTVIINS